MTRRAPSRPPPCCAHGRHGPARNRAQNRQVEPPPPKPPATGFHGRPGPRRMAGPWARARARAPRPLRAAQGPPNGSRKDMSGRTPNLPDVPTKPLQCPAKPASACGRHAHRQAPPQRPRAVIITPGPGGRRHRLRRTPGPGPSPAMREGGRGRCPPPPAAAAAHWRPARGRAAARSPPAPGAMTRCRKADASPIGTYNTYIGKMHYFKAPSR